MSTALATARASDSPVPVDAATTSYMTLVANPDGTFSARQDITPQRVKQNNAWVPVDATLAPAADGTLHTNATVVGITISDGGTGPLATEDDGNGHKLTFTWPGTLPTPTVSGSKATFSDVYPGIDLIMDARPTGLSDKLIVQDAEAAANPALKSISIGVAGTGLTVSTASSGSIQAVTAAGTPVFGSPTPLMWDSAQTQTATSTKAAKTNAPNSEPSATTPHQAVVPESVQGNAIVLKPDQNMLTNASTVYPVTIDPTWTEIASAQLEMWSDKTYGIYDGTPVPWTNYDGTAVRVGNDGTATARSLLSFDETFANQLQPYYPSPTQIDMYVVKADLNLQRQLGSGCVNVDVWRSNPFGTNSNWGNQYSPQLWPPSGRNHNGTTWNNPIGHSLSCSNNPSPYLSDIDVTAQAQDILGTNGAQPGKTFTLGLRASNEALTTSNYGSFNASSTAQSNTYLSMNFVAEPLVGKVTVGNAVVGNHGLQYAPCSTDSNNPSWLPIQAASIPISAPVTDLDPSRWLSWGLDITDNTASGATQQLGPVWQQGNGTAQATLAPTTSVTGSSVGTGSLSVQDGHSYTAYFAARDDKEDASWNQGNTNPNSQQLYNAWYSGDGAAPSSSLCYFRAAFTAPNQPKITASDFPASGQTLVNGYPTVGTGGKTITVNATSTTTPIDHFDWALNTSSTNEGIGANGTPNCYVNGAAVQGIGCGTVGGFNGTNITAQIPIPASGEHAGNNYLYVSAVDKAGNVSQYARWDFFLAQAWQPVSFGNVTGDGIPDLMGVDSTGNLVTYQANLDPTPGASSLVAGSASTMAPNSVQAAAATSAPNGSSWKTALYTHRGSERVQPTDDMFAWDQTKDAGGTVTGHLYYYYNAVHLTVATPAGQNPNPPANAFTQTQRAVITRPACSPSTLNDFCTGYDPTWNSVQQVLALGPVSGGCNIAAPTTACKTNLITVESYPPGSPSRLWLFSPAGIGQVRNPVLLSVSQPGNWDWSTTHLMAPGNAAGHPAPAGASSLAGGLPDLWAVDADGTLWQFTNHSDSGIPGTGLGDLTAKTMLGAPRQFASYQNYMEPGVDPSGKPDLWAVTPDRQIIALTGPIGSASASSLSQTVTSPTQIGWTSSAGVNSLQGTPINGGLNGQIVSDVAGGVTGQKCLDDLNGGSIADIYDCNGTWAQQWSFQPDGTIRLIGSNPASPPNLCLDSNGGVQATRVVVQACDPSTAPGHRGNYQIWRNIASPSAVGRYWIYSPGTGFCLDDTGYSTTNGNQFQLASCWDSAATPNSAQRFTLPNGAGQTQLVEAENLGAWGSVNGPATQVQGNCCGISLSNGNQLYFPGNAANQSVTLNYYVANAGTYSITPALTMTNDRAKVTVTVDNGTSGSIKLPATVDAYRASGVSLAPVHFGTVNLSAGRHSFTFTAADTNPASIGNRYVIGIDDLSLVPVTATGPNVALNLAAVGALNSPVTADASASFPGAAAITSYKFDFGDGTVVGPQSGPTAAHTYSAAGTYMVTTTVTDTNNASATTTNHVVVLSGPTVANGDFESGTLAGWGASYNSGITTSNPHGGTYAGQINAPTGGNGSIEQVVNGLTPNTSYTLTGWVRTDGGATILGTKQYDAADDDTGATTTATAWTQLSNQFTTGPTNTSVDVYCYRSTAGTSACDDFTLLATPAAGAAANPDFETGNLAGWNESYNSGVTTTNPHSGTYAGQINASANDGNGSIEQIVTGLTPNTTYTLTGWIRTDGGATALGTKQYNAANDDTSATTTATSWTQLSNQFTTGPTNTSVDIYCYRDTAGTSACDDISLTKN